MQVGPFAGGGAAPLRPEPGPGSGVCWADVHTVGPGPLCPEWTRCIFGLRFSRPLCSKWVLEEAFPCRICLTLISSDFQRYNLLITLTLCSNSPASTELLKCISHPTRFSCVRSRRPGSGSTNRVAPSPRSDREHPRRSPGEICVVGSRVRPRLATADFLPHTGASYSARFTRNVWGSD